MSTVANFHAAIARAALIIPGARLETRPAVESPTIILPIPGLSVRFKVDGHPTMILRREGRDRVSCNIPTVGQNKNAGALRIVRELEQMVQRAASAAPAQRERDDKLRLTQHVGCWLTDAERAEAETVAKARGMSTSGMFRRGLRLAMAEDAAYRATTEDNEAQIRSVLRMLISAKRDLYPENFTLIAESGSFTDVLYALRDAFRLAETGVEAARLLGLAWVIPSVPRTD